MNAADNLDLIDRYLKKELAGEELQLFEQRLAADPALVQEVEMQRKIVQMIKEREILGALQKAQEDITNRGTFSRWSSRDEVELVKLKASIEPASRELFSIRREPPSRNPEFKISYEGDSNPPFPIQTISGKSYFNYVKIYSSSESENFHYRFKVNPDKPRRQDPKIRLSLFGTFDPAQLTLLYNKKEDKEIIKLRIKLKEYRLELNQPTAPLVEENETE